MTGPHDGQELGLMLSGQKPLALFYAFIDQLHTLSGQKFEPYVYCGVVRQVQKRYPPLCVSMETTALHLDLYSLPGEEWRFDSALEIFDAVWLGTRPTDRSDDIELGRLLGYSDNEIAQLFTRQHGFMLAS